MKFVLFPLRLLWAAFVVVHDFFDWILANRLAQVLEFALLGLLLGYFAIRLVVQVIVSSSRVGLSGTLGSVEWWLVTVLLVGLIATLLELTMRCAGVAVLTWKRDSKMEAYRRLRRLRPIWG